MTNFDPGLFRRRPLGRLYEPSEKREIGLPPLSDRPLGGLSRSRTAMGRGLAPEEPALTPQEPDIRQMIRQRILAELTAPEAPAPRLMQGRGPGAYEMGEERYQPSKLRRVLGATLAGVTAGREGAQAGMETGDRFFNREYGEANQRYKAGQEERQGRLRGLQGLAEFSQGDRPFAVSGGYIDANGKFVPTGAESTSEDLSGLAPLLGVEGEPGLGALRRVPKSAVSGLMTTLRPRESQAGTWVRDARGRLYRAELGEGSPNVTEIEMPEGFEPILPGGLTPEQRQQQLELREMDLDLQRERMEFARQAAAQRRARGATGGLTEAQRNVMLRNLRSLVLQIRRHPIMSRQVRDMSDADLMEQEAQLTYGLSLDELRPSGTPAGTAPAQSPARQQALPPGWTR